MDALIAGFNSKDEKSCKQVFDIVNPRLVGYLFHKFDPQSAEDIAGESWYRLLKSEHEFESVEHITRFLFFVAKNYAIDQIKYKVVANKKFEKYVEDTIEHLEYILYDSNLYDIKLSDKRHTEVINYINDILQQQPPRRKRIIRLFYECNLSSHTIAKNLGITSQTCRNTITDFRNVLRKNILQLQHIYGL